MKKLVLTIFLGLSIFFTVNAQDVYICHTVLFCNDKGQCVEIEICDIVESLVDHFSHDFGGNFNSRTNTLTLTGFSKKTEGLSVRIKRDTRLKLPNGTESNALVGRSVVPGKYKISHGRLSLKLGEKG